MFSNNMLSRGATNSITVDLSDMFNPATGPTRFANASTSTPVKEFFRRADDWQYGSLDSLKDGNGEVILSKQQAISAFGLSSYDNGIYIDQTNYRDSTDDFAERVYIWGTMALMLADDIIFRVSSDGVPSIENFSISMRNQSEDFDWIGGNSAGNVGSEHALRPGIDPSDLANSEGGLSAL